MKILIICSKAFYKDIAPIKERLEIFGHIVELPNRKRQNILNDSLSLSAAIQ